MFHKLTRLDPTKFVLVQSVAFGKAPKESLLNFPAFSSRLDARQIPVMFSVIIDVSFRGRPAGPTASDLAALRGKVAASQQPPPIPNSGPVMLRPDPRYDLIVGTQQLDLRVNPR
jgi:hypothetical protein